MKFNNLVAIVAILSMASNAYAYSEGTLRDSEATSGVVILNTNTNSNSNSNSAAAIAQPTTVVEAAPAVDSKAELMRKARQSAEIQTEQKIVEKLEESRLREEQQRAERLFGNKLDPQPEAAAPAAAATATAVATPNGAAATATAVTTLEPVKEEKPQVVIEKVEIIQPKEDVAPVMPVSESKMEVEEAKEHSHDRIYVSGIAGAPMYNASNVKSNYALGAAVGQFIGANIGVEGTFLYSNHSVDTYWVAPIYKDLDQYDVSASARYYFLTNRVKPYAGASVTYIYRKYDDRVRYNQAWYVNPNSETEESHAVNLGLMLGLDFALNEHLMIGGGMDWNFNMMNKNNFDSSNYGNTVANSKPLEEIDYSTFKLNLKYVF